MKTIKTAILFMVLGLLTTNFAQEKAQELFKTKCAACHTIGKGKLIGPDLVNVQQRHPKEWLREFIKSSQTLINNGDTTAVKLFEENNKMIMPDQPLSDSEIDLVLGLTNIDGAVAGVNNSELVILADIAQDDIINGKELFEGTVKFTNNGPACISCHNVEHSSVITGGLLAKDLTNVFARMNEAGVNAIVSSPPFPAMIDSYGNNKLNEEEVKSLLAFLYYVNKSATPVSTSNSNSSLLIGVVLGLIILFSIFTIMWFQVKKRSVNDFMFNR